MEENIKLHNIAMLMDQIRDTVSVSCGYCTYMYSEGQYTRVSMACVAPCSCPWVMSTEQLAVLARTALFLFFYQTTNAEGASVSYVVVPCSTLGSTSEEGSEEDCGCQEEGKGRSAVPVVRSQVIPGEPGVREITVTIRF